MAHLLERQKRGIGGRGEGHRGRRRTSVCHMKMFVVFVVVAKVESGERRVECGKWSCQADASLRAKLLLVVVIVTSIVAAVVVFVIVIVSN